MGSEGCRDEYKTCPCSVVRDGNSRSPQLIQIGPLVQPCHPPLTMAATTAENLNGVSNGFRWSGTMASNASVRVSSHRFSSSGQVSTQNWNTSLPPTCSGPSFPDSTEPLEPTHANLSEEWPHLREIIKHKIQKVRLDAPQSRPRLTGVPPQEH